MSFILPTITKLVSNYNKLGVNCYKTRP